LTLKSFARVDHGGQMDWRPARGDADFRKTLPAVIRASLEEVEHVFVWRKLDAHFGATAKPRTHGAHLDARLGRVQNGTCGQPLQECGAVAVINSAGDARSGKLETAKDSTFPHFAQEERDTDKIAVSKYGNNIRRHVCTSVIERWTNADAERIVSRNLELKTRCRRSRSRSFDRIFRGGGTSV
jgi:hypothetical protein